MNLRKIIRETVREQSESDGKEFVEQEVAKILRTGNKIEAIKKARELTLLSLRDAVDFVNDVAQKYGIVIEIPGDLVVTLKIYKSGQGMGVQKDPVGYSVSVQDKSFAKTVRGKTGAAALRALADAFDRAGFLE